MPRDFLDSNVLVYAFTEDPRTVTARALLARGCTISVQGLNEFVNVARRKLGHSWDEIRAALAVIRDLCPIVVPIGLDTHEAALRLAERYGFAMFDALMVATASKAGCTTLWSKDMQDGMIIDDKLRIANPFRAPG
jgi:predicted nucleic acid-binding protein